MDVRREYIPYGNPFSRDVVLQVQTIFCGTIQRVVRERDAYTVSTTGTEGERTTENPYRCRDGCRTYLCSLQQLRRLSLVCKLFRSLVIPHLFEEQSLDVAALQVAQELDRDNWMDCVRYLHRTVVQLDKLQGSFAPLVHTWKATLHRGMRLSRYHSEIKNIHL
jgi:hypothetical protein